jgi:hypothetical protein
MARKSILGNKITLLQCIKEKSDILLGNFTKKADKDEQVKEWKNLHEYAQEIGLVASGRAWNYTRDKFWDALKTEHIQKITQARNKNQEPKLNEADELIIEILEGDQGSTRQRKLYPSLSQESVASTQYSVSSTSYQPQVAEQNPKPREPIKRGRVGIETTGSSKVRVINIQLPAEDSPKLNYSTTQKSFFGDEPQGAKRMRLACKNDKNEDDDDDDDIEELDDDELAQKKLRLEVKNLILNNYKAKLEIFKLEKELHMPRSKFSKDVAGY